MKREEEINNAIENYINGLFEDVVEIAIKDYENMQDAFVAGAQWADNHPKSPWINVKDDLPCNHEEFTRNSRSTKLVLVRTRKAAYFVNYMIKEKSKWEWFCAVDDIEDEIEYWMPIPELPKE